MAKIEDLAKKLLDATRAGHLNWQTTADDRTYLWSSTSATFLVAEVGDEKKSVIQIALRDNMGATVESKRYLAESITSRDYVSLYREARRNARGTDQLIADMIGQLDELGNSGDE